MSRKLDASLKKIDALFEKCYEKGINPHSKSDKRWSEGTKDTYADMVKAFVREYHIVYGIADITKFKEENISQLIQKRIDRYHEGDVKQSYNLKTLVAALNAFNHGVANTNIFKRAFALGNVQEIRQTMKGQYVIRNAKTSSVLRAKPEECKSVLDNIKRSGYDVKTREVAYHVGKISMLTGGRITSILKLKASDFTIDKNTNEIHFIKDKGGLSRAVRIDKETANYLDKLREGKKDNDRLFSSVRTKRGQGTFKPTEELRKEVTKIISNAGRHLEKSVKVTIKDCDGKPKTVDVRQKFSPHSFRKSFALERVSYYLSKFNSQSAIDKYVARRIEEDKKLKEKLNTLRERVNKERNVSRKLKAIEYAIFFGSVDMGHFRNDIITSFYTTYREVQEYFEETEDIEKE